MELKNYLVVAGAMLMLGACSDENEPVLTVENGTYEIVLNLQTAQGESNSVGQTSRAIVDGKFSSAYDASSLYVHTTEEGKSLELPLEGNSVKFTLVCENNQCTILAGDKELSWNDGKEDVYFSSIEGETWSAVRASWQGFTPLTHQVALVNSGNPELYRSEKDYSADDLSNLSEGQLKMDRICSAFKLTVLFTDLENVDNSNSVPGVVEINRYTLTEEDWKKVFGDRWFVYSKAYVGPCFPEFFNVNTKESSWGLVTVNGNEEYPTGAYYVTNNQYYTLLETEIHESSTPTHGFYNDYAGVGYRSNTTLFTPVDLNHESGQIVIYLLFKSADNGEGVGNEDVGCVINEVTLSGFSPVMNYVNDIVLVYDYRKLHDALDKYEGEAATQSRGSMPQVISMEPDVVIYK